MERRFNQKGQKLVRQELRSNMTPAEVTLWKQLRGRALRGFKFRRQFGVGPFIVDFYCPEARLAVEVDGDSHYVPDASGRDEHRERFIKTHGIQIVRFTNLEVRDDLESVISVIEKLLTPSTFPSAEGERTEI